MKKIISLVMAMFLLFAVLPVSAIAESAESTELTVWDGSVATAFASGSGAQDDPYIIMTGAELAYLAQMVNEGYLAENLYYELGADIYLNDTSAEGWQAAANCWTPIGIMQGMGDTTLAFRGNFDGKGHKIVGLYVAELSVSGLFGCTDNATIKNIVLEDAYVFGDFAGGIAAWHYIGTISGCTVYGKITSDRIAGGIAGANLANIEDCVNYATVEGGDLAGGIASAIDATVFPSAVRQCVNFGDVFGLYIAGGILGGISNSSDNSVIECVNAGSVSGSAVGGIVGSTLLDESSSGVITISDCINNGDIAVIAGGHGAGIVSEYYDGVIVKNCWNNGTATLEEGAVFSAAAISINYIYAPSDETTGETTELVPSFENCYYLDTTAENGTLGFETTPDGIYAVSAENMAEQATFEGFDFETVWGIANGEPVLQFAHEHEFTSYVTDEAYHYPVCECGFKGEGGEHTPGDWEVIFDATCEDDGMVGRKCTVCNIYVETEVIEAYGCLRGDVNNDGKIDADDYILLKRIYFGMAKMEDLDLPQTAVYRCDVNIDSVIDADDYILLKRVYFGMAKIGE